MSFSFVYESVEVRVHSEVGEGVTRLVWEEQQRRPEADMEASEDANGA